MKTPILVVVLLAIIGGAGFYGFQQYQKTRAALSGRKLAAAQQQQSAQQSKQLTEAQAKKQAAEDATRKEIDASLKPLKVTSILPGQPGIVIIDKQEYAEGDVLPVARRKLRVTKVQEDGVLLACDGLSFHLDPPAAPDLAASRKR